MKKHWFKVQIKMQLIDSIRERIYEGLKDDPIELFYAKQQLNQLEKDLDLFKSNLSKLINKYSEYLPGLKTNEQVCDNCQSTKVVQYEDVFVCQDCSAIHSFIVDNINKAEEKHSTDINTRHLVKKFKERILELDIYNERLTKDYEKLASKVKENPANRMPSKDFCILCLTFKNSQVPPNGLSIPNGEAPLITTITKCKDFFEKLEWTFPSDQIREYVIGEKTKKAKSRLDKIL